MSYSLFCISSAMRDEVCASGLSIMPRSGTALIRSEIVWQVVFRLVSFVAVVVDFVFPFLSSLGLMSCLFNNPLPLWQKSTIEFSCVLTSKTRTCGDGKRQGFCSPGRAFAAQGSLQDVPLFGEPRCFSHWPWRLERVAQGGAQSQLWCNM